MVDTLSANGVIGLLLGVVAFLLVRLLKSIDKNTEALIAIDKAVQALTIQATTQKEDIARIEGDFLRRTDALDSKFEMIRSRMHDLTNKCQAIFLKLELRNFDKKDE